MNSQGNPWVWMNWTDGRPQSYGSFVVMWCLLRYKHFLSLTVAMSIRLEPDDSTRNAYLQFAEDLMKHFVMCSADLYGRCFPVYNVHGLMHLHEDVRHFKRSLNK